MFQYLTNYLKPKEELGESEVEWAYRQFLKRAPESPEAIQGHLKVSKNLKQLVETILASQEYKDKSTGLKDSQTHERVYPLTVEECVEITSSCQDTQNIPKVPDAGKTLVIDGQRVQIMHEGTKVIAGGYNGEWMERIITRLSGHHEPQEELLFHHLLRYVREGSLIVELGAFWAYYTNWYLGAVKGSSALCIEPDANSMACGLANLALNGREANFINARVGEAFCEETLLRRESDGATVSVPCHNMETLMDILGNRTIEMLHMDVQGAEFPFLKSIERVAKQGLVRFVLVSTHHESISGSKTTHVDCMRELTRLGAFILAEHSIEESYSGDGLIVASFLPGDRDLILPEVSLNSSSASLFGPKSYGESDKYLVSTVYGPMVVLKKDRVIAQSLLTQKCFQENKIDEVCRFLIKKYQFTPNLFIDIGANIGTHLIYSLNNGLFCSAVGFEMEDENFATLKINVLLNRLEDKVKLFNVALSDRHHSVEMEISPDNFGDHRLRLSGYSKSNMYNEKNRETRKTTSNTLDDILEKNNIHIGKNTLVWIDTQGHEGHIVAGSARAIESAERSFFVVEVWPYGLELSGGRDYLFEFLKGANHIYDINSPSWQESELTLEKAKEIYDNMLNSLENSHILHTDFLCIR